MKQLLLLILTVNVISSFSQKTNGISVTLQKQTLYASLAADNDSKVIIIPASLKGSEQLQIKNELNNDKDWKRSFQIFDPADNVLLEIDSTKQSTYSVPVNQLRTKLKKGIPYSLYTIAVPTTPIWRQE